MFEKSICFCFILIIQKGPHSGGVYIKGLSTMAWKQYAGNDVANWSLVTNIS